MSTFPGDFVRLYLSVGTQDVALLKVGLVWPPPERLVVEGFGVRPATAADPPGSALWRATCSELADEDARAGRARCAEYEWEPAWAPGWEGS